MVFAGQAHAGEIKPLGVGDLMPSPKLTIPDGGGTLYETYGSSQHVWILDEQFGWGDTFEATFHGIADLFMLLTVVVASAAIVIVQWIFQLTSIPALENAISGSIGGAAKGLSLTLLPTALAVGGLVAFVQHKKGGGGGGMSQIAWVLISGVFSVSLLTSPQVWVDGLGTARQVGADVAMNATSAGLGDGKAEFPFKTPHEPKFTGTGREDMIRKSNDAVWRAYVATPWCVAEFGSREACEKYGADVLEKGSDRDEREEWLKGHVTEAAVGKDSVQWRQGHNPGGRVAVTIPAFINVVLFAALVIILAFTSLASFIGALFLLLTGVIFACLWVIPGRPRQWGLSWFDQLLARTLESFIATLVLGAVLSLQVATTTLFDEYGWLPTSGLAIAAAIVGMQFRSVLAQIFGVRGSTAGGMLAGFVASRLLNGGGGKRRRNSGGANRPQGSNPGGGRRRLPGGGGGQGGPGGTPPEMGNGVPTTPRVPPQRPPVARPLPTGGATGQPSAGSLAGTHPRAGNTAAGTINPTVTMERVRPEPRPAGAAVEAGAVRPSVPAQKPRPALPAGVGTGSSSSEGAVSGRVLPPASSTTRAEAGAAPGYAFRQAPTPTASAEGLPYIRATVVRSVPNKPPAPSRPGRRSTPPPTRQTAPTERRPMSSPPPPRPGASATNSRTAATSARRG
ncbi:hypothetical protein [Streptomyces sp. H27-H5]|uniref:hypothetical protein n=1 Tax=Streptomyces sp. H27-H5 TaxID=2996460 RepID=UPI00226D5C5A|nr:hypothetical protein [Streptomyces sp. H27-H5]